MASSLPIINREVHLFCDVISVDPIIIVGFGSPGPCQPAITLSEALKDKKVYYLLWSWWTPQDNMELLNLVHYYSVLTEKYPNHDFLFMVNEEVDRVLLEKCDVRAKFCHQNAFLDQSVFRVLPDQSKDYEAIYTARLESFKRHILASKLKNVGLIYYSSGGGNSGAAYKRKIRKILPHAVFLNENKETGSDQFLSPPEICKLYNKSKAGLCLSAVEGGMYACTEYLLSGLPVVTTKNIGGRDFFLEKSFSRIVDPDPYAVRKAVDELVAENIPPNVIRKKTLMRMLQQRQIFIDHVQAIYDREGVDRKFADEWDVVFTNKFCVWGIPNWQVLTYLRDHEGYKGAITQPLKRVYNVKPPEDFSWA